MLRYLAALFIGGTLAIIVATGVVWFFHVVHEERRARIAAATRRRVAKLASTAEGRLFRKPQARQSNPDLTPPRLRTMDRGGPLVM